MLSFATWLVNTPPSIALANSPFVVPLMQTIHIVAIAVLFSSVLMVGLRVMGWAARDQALSEVIAWHRRWFLGALIVLAATGTVLVLTEPPRELMAISFWLKMSTLAVAVAIAVRLVSSVERHRSGRDTAVPAAAKVCAVLSFGAWCLVVFLGRFIAYDEQIWTAVLGRY